MMALWAGATYLAKKVGPWTSFIAAIPATFMSAVSCTYILYADEGFKLGTNIAYPVGIVFAVLCFALFLFKAVMPALKNKGTGELA